MTLRLTVITTAAAAAAMLMFSDQDGPQAQGTPETAVAEALPAPSPGDILQSADVQFIDKPGRYGLGADLPGNRYAIVRGHLVRIDTTTMQVESILRTDARALD